MLFFRLEVLCFILSFLYILYYSGDRVFSWYRIISLKKLEKQQKKEEREKKKKSWESFVKKNECRWLQRSSVRITHEQSEKIREISKRAHINISRGYYETARILIVEWLALKKEDKELNLLLADVYEREKNYKNAGYIYKDMLDIHEDDEYILQRLWNIYALLGKNKKSFEVYQRAHKRNRMNMEVLDILSHLGLEIQDYKKSFKFANMYLKEKPRDAEKLSIRGYCLEQLGKGEEAVKSYRKVLELQPYNTEVHDRVKALEK